MAEFSNLQGYDVKDAYARKSIEMLEEETSYFPFVMNEEDKENYRKDTLSCIASYLAYSINADGTHLNSVNALSNTPEKIVAKYWDEHGYMGLLGQGVFDYEETLNIGGTNYNIMNLDCSAFLSLITKCRSYQESPYPKAFSGVTNEKELFPYAIENGGINNKPYTFDFKNHIATWRMAFEMNQSGNVLHLINDINNDLNNFNTGDILFFGNVTSYPDRFLGVHHCGYFLKNLNELNNYLSEYNITCKPYNNITTDFGYIVHVTYTDSTTTDAIRIESLENYLNNRPNEKCYICRGESNALISNKSYMALTGLFNGFNYMTFGSRSDATSHNIKAGDGYISATQFRPEGNMVVDGTNLNDLKDGVYFTTDETDLSTIVNMPSGANRFYIHVIGNELNEYQKTQVMVCGNGNVFTRRTDGTNVYSEWRSPFNTHIAVNNSNMNDFNEGYTVSTSSTNISSITNKPSEITSTDTIMRVLTFKGYDGYNDIQLYFTSGGRMFTRLKPMNSRYWGSWYKFAGTQT